MKFGANLERLISILVLSILNGALSKVIVLRYGVSKAIKHGIRKNDRDYRYGGEEIVIILKGCFKPFKINKRFLLSCFFYLYLSLGLFLNLRSLDL